jgi:AraC-like DNA-binding protein
MKPVRKRFDAESSFPFAFVYKDTKNAQSELPDHLHDWYELVYVYRGKGTFFIDRTFYEMRQGDLFAIPGNTIHRAFPDKDEPVTSTAVFFSPGLIQSATLGETVSYLQCFEQAKRLRNYKFTLPFPERLTLQDRIEGIREELRAAEPGYRHAVALSLHQILLQLSRGRGQADTRRPANPVSGSHWMNGIMLHIDRNLQGNVGLSALAGRASVTPAHFSRVFKEMTGMNVSEYVTTKRIFKARELLLETDLSIGDIAGSCGFESLPHFHRMFKRVMGATPAAYRKDAKGPSVHESIRIRI